MPLQLAAARQQRLPELHRLDEPLAAGDDLERPVALLVELDRVRDRPRLADQVARLAQQLDDAARAPSRPTGWRAGRSACCARAASRDSQPGAPHVTGAERAVRQDDRAHRQRQLAPPDHVGEVAEGADHRDAAALLGIGQRMRPSPAPARRTAACSTVGAEERLVALVVGMRHERDARRNQLRPRRLDLDVAPPVRARANRMRW